MAGWLEIEPLKLNESDPDSPKVHAKVDEIVHVSRAEALVGCSDLRKFKDARQLAFPESVQCGLSRPRRAWRAKPRALIAYWTATG
jgi:hypothetical protein